MADIYRVKIDLAKLAANLGGAEKAEALLREAGFVWLGSDWYECEEISLGALGKGEVVEVREAWVGR